MISQVTRRWVAAPDVAATLTDTTSGALATVAAAQYASIAWARGRWLTGRAPTDRIVARLDAWQAELGQGPCLDALREQHTVVIPDMRSEVRWPVFAARATESKVGSMVSVPLSVRREGLGVLNLYATRPHAFSGEDERTGAVFATCAAVALYRAVERDHVRALASRDVIGQATDVLMRRYGLTDAAAFDRLVCTCRDADLSLAEVACWLVAEHDHRPLAGAGGPAGQRGRTRWGPPEMRHGLRVTQDRAGEAVVVHASGEVDMHSAGGFAEMLRTGANSVRPPGLLVIDLTGIRFFSAAGLTLLVAAQQRCRERQVALRVVATHRSVLRLMQITGLNALFDVMPSLEEATRPHAA